MNRQLLPLLCLSVLLPLLRGDGLPPSNSDNDDTSQLGSGARPPIAPLIAPIAGSLEPKKPKSVNWPKTVNWEALLRQAGWFLAAEHAFRVATERGTRSSMSPPVRGYLRSVGSLHGWSDGDPFYVNYIAHPMQGSTAGYIWVHNDNEYRTTQFGMNRRYWKSRLRATAFSWAYSTQFEIGPLSEASVGHIQSRYPQQGFVDHVVTPTLGLGWMVAEDAVDRYLLTAFERRVNNVYMRILARGFLNPTRSMANMMRGRMPFYREDRSVIAEYSSSYLPVSSRALIEKTSKEQSAGLPPDNGPAPFELTVSPKRQTFIGSDAGVCVGGGAEAAFRMSNNWQFILDVNGCRLSNLPRNTSGDTLTYLVGPRWTPSERRLRPYMQFLIGGAKLTKETVSPETKRALEEAAERNGNSQVDRALFALKETTHSFALAAGTGVDLNLGRAAALKLASLEYTRSWNRPLDGVDYNNGLQLKLGVTLRVGTW
jgi:hypothetical protein